MLNTGILQETLILLSASILVVLVFKQLKLSPVLGYFVAGAVIGDYGLGIISADSTRTFGEFGIVFLLFAIGLELTFERLKAMRKHVFGFGTLQVMITFVLITFCLHYITTSFNISVNTAIIIGGSLAFSSTAIVLQVIAEYRRQSTQVGRLSLATLIMQDFAVVPLLVLIPMLSGEGASIAYAMSEAFFKAILVLLIIFILGRLFLRPLFGMIRSSTSAKNNELFVGATIVIALGSAWMTEHMGLSLALGAFVAGLLVAETEFQHQAEESIAPFRGLFLGLYFMTVGMGINANLVIENIGIIMGLSIGLIIVKAVVITLLSLWFNFSLGTAIHTGLLLSQGSEFAFILFKLGVDNKVLADDLGQILMLVVTVTMALTPLLFIIGDYFSNLLDGRKEVSEVDTMQETEDLEGHVLVIGFGRVGRMVARLLEAERINYVAIDSDSDLVAEHRKDGFPVYFGDAMKIENLRKLGLPRGESVIVAIENKVIMRRVTKNIHKVYPDMPIIVRAQDLSQQAELRKLGARMIVPETFETGLQLGGAVLKTVGVSEYEVSRIKNRFRAGNYMKALEDDGAPVIKEESE